MATLKSQIESLIAYANETTGKSDTHLGDAVKSLVDGYGQGGGGLQVLEGKVTTTELKNNIVIEHNLGVRPIAAIVEIEGEYETPNTIMAIGCYMMLGKFSGSSNMYGSLAAAALNTNGTISYNNASYLSDTTPYAGSLTEEYVKTYSSNGNRNFLTGTYNYKIIYAKDSGGGEHGCVDGEVTIDSQSRTITINRSVPLQPYHVELRYKGDLSAVKAETVGADVVKNMYDNSYVQLCFRNNEAVYIKSNSTNIGVDGCTIACYSTALFAAGDYTYKISY